MGRYNNIKVYHEGSWKTPTQCRVYSNGAWQDLGTATSYNTKSLYVYHNNTWKRATLNRHDYTLITDQYISGPFNLLPQTGYCRCSQSDGAGAYNWYFRATVEKDSATDQNIFYCGVGSPAYPGQNYCRITWLADGRIKMDAAYLGNVRTLYSSNANTTGSHYINVYSNAGSYWCTIEFDDVVTGGNVGTSFMWNYTSTIVGDTNTIFRGQLSAAGVDYAGYTHSCSFNASTANGTDGYQYSNVNHVEHTLSYTDYE